MEERREVKNKKNKNKIKSTIRNRRKKIEIFRTKTAKQAKK